LTDVNDANDDPVASYEYDYRGRRISKTVDGSTTKHCYDGGQIIAEYDGSNNLLRKFVYGPGIDEPICMIDVTDANKVYYYHFDGLGSVVALSDVNSVIVERYSYDVFGEPNRTSDVNNPYLFTGRAYDSETGLYYYRARYYKPSIGRFLQTDPMGYLGGLNLYTYCGNNPVIFADPYGEKLIFIGDPRYIEQVKKDLEQLKKDDPIIKAKIEALECSNHQHYLSTTTTGNQSITFDDIGEVVPLPIWGGSDTAILYNPSDDQGWGGTRDPIVGLAHELDHAYRKDIGTMDRRLVDGVRISEILAIIQENRIRAVTGDPFRYSYYEDGAIMRLVDFLLYGDRETINGYKK
jgi:RHS repeat-associated protein